MKAFRIPSLALAAILQVLPFARIVAVQQQPIAPLWAIILRWAGAAAAALGGVQAVSGASTVITSPTTAQGTNGVPFKQFRLATAPDQAHYWTAKGLPAGLILNGTSGSTLWYINGTPAASGQYNVQLTAKDQISSGADRTVTSTLVITIINTGTAPAITGPPSNQTVTQGATVTFSVAASGTAPVSYQWQKNSQNLAGATGSSLVLPNVTSADAATYTVLVSNSLGSANASATLTVNVPPAITVPPLPATITAGNSVTLSVSATGTAPLSYQWTKNNQNIPGASSPSLTFSPAATSDSGDYQVVVSNVAGSATGGPATLTVNAPIFAPVIIAPPVSQTVTAGAAVTLSVTASGTAPLSYQWTKNNQNIPGAHSPTLSFAATVLSDSGDYGVIVSNSAGAATGGPATLTVNAPVIAPAITAFPASQTVTAGSAVSLSVTANGTAPLSYQWTKDNQALPGATAASLTLAAASTADSGDYRVIVSNSAGAATGGPATLTVTPQTIAPSITNPPASQTVTAGAAVTLSVAATGTEPFAYQWSKNNLDIPGATSSTLAFASVDAADSGDYRVRVSNPAGNVIGGPATLTVNPAPIAPAITTPPASQTVTVGSAVSFSVAATGTAPLAYQWKKNNADLPGATNPTLSIPSAALSDAGDYRVLVSNAAGNALSDPATLTVNAAPTGPTITSGPANLSVHPGQNAQFSVTATGAAPLSYQWFLGTTEIPGATGSTLTLNGATTDAAGSYSVEVRDANGATHSAPATLEVVLLQILSAIEQDEALVITWKGIPGVKYGWVKKDDLTETWQPLAPITATLQNGLLTAKVNNTNGKFFRLAVLP